MFTVNNNMAAFKSAFLSIAINPLQKSATRTEDYVISAPTGILLI